MDLIKEISQTIESALTEAEVYVLDPQNDGTHLQGLVISPDFRNISLVKQHQIVMQALKEHFNTSLHALALKTFTPEKWEENKHKYNSGALV